jgi:hypothetical protein
LRGLKHPTLGFSQSGDEVMRKSNITKARIKIAVQAMNEAVFRLDSIVLSLKSDVVEHIPPESGLKSAQILLEAAGQCVDVILEGIQIVEKGAQISVDGADFAEAFKLLAKLGGGNFLRSDRAHSEREALEINRALKANAH